MRREITITLDEADMRAAIHVALVAKYGDEATKWTIEFYSEHGAPLAHRIEARAKPEN